MSTASIEPRHERETVCLAALVVGIGIYQVVRSYIEGIEGALPVLFIFIAIAALAFVPACIAKAKGRSETGFYLFGLVFFVPALVVALLLGDRSDAA